MTQAERDLEAAVDRLLSGTPTRGTGELTGVNLAREADVSRATLYRHPQILERMKSAARTQPRQKSPTADDELANDLLHLRKDLKQCRKQVKALEKKEDLLAQAVYVLDQENARLRRELERTSGVRRLRQAGGHQETTTQ